MSARALIWLPDASLETARRWAAAHLQAWAQHWGLQLQAKWTVERLSVPTPDASTCELTSDREPGAVWARGLEQALFGQAAAGSAIAEGVVTRVTADLRGRFAPASPAADADAAAHGDWGLRLSTELFGCRWRLDLDVQQLQALQLLQRPALPPLPPLNIEQACARLPLRWTVEVGRANLPLSDLLHLSAGDVIPLDRSLNELVQLQLSGHTLRLQAELGSHQGQRAVRCAAAA